MFWQHYIENKKHTFLVCIPKQVYAAILEYSENNDLFQNHQSYFPGSLKFPWQGLCKTRKRRRQAEMEKKN